MGGVPGDFAEASVVEDAGGPEPVVAGGVGDVAACDFEQVVEDPLEVVGGFAEVPGGVSREGRVDRGLLYCLHVN